VISPGSTLPEGTGGSYYCQICGRKVHKDSDLKHECPARTLAGIDGANTRAWNKELSPPSEHQEPFNRTYGDRLKEGWNTIRSSGDRSHKDS